jgi:hypothetical protein
MIRNLAAAISLYDWNISGIEQVFSFAILALSEYWRMFKQPDFIQSLFVASVRKVAHSLPAGRVILLLTQ